MTDGYLRIGEFGERVGVSPDLLRAWERRYGLLRPDRSPGGFRLYSDADLARVRRMQALVDQGLSTAEAARSALRHGMSNGDAEHDTATGDGTSTLRELREPALVVSAGQLSSCLETYDEVGAQRALDELFSAFTPEAVFREVLLPELFRIGQRWQAGELDVAQEHFASSVVRGRLFAMARGWGTGTGPLAVLATPPMEAHDLALVMFGLALRRRGWRIIFLGSDTPIPSVRAAVAVATPQIVVLAAVDDSRFEQVRRELSGLASEVPVALAGQGATRSLADALGAFHLASDPVTAADHLASTPPSELVSRR